MEESKQEQSAVATKDASVVGNAVSPKHAPGTPGIVPVSSNFVHKAYHDMLEMEKAAGLLDKK